ncbi:MAG: leucine-rich repeat domain-containing protein [Verrucomicrobiota bacterium]|nr:leucine-rich repeat domain-containing protein [Verrucomicrobiota bacterium]
MHYTSSVTSIGAYAFNYCTNLTTIIIPNGVTNISDDAFYECYDLTNVTIAGSVSSIGESAFGYCSKLTGVFFYGSARAAALDVFNGDPGKVYYLPGTAGWGGMFGGLGTALWMLPYPLILEGGSNFGVQADGFNFRISWATNLTVVVEGCTNVANPAWQPLQTNTLIGGESQFTDSQWTNYPIRFYRVRWP